jgi:cytochrome c
MFRPVRLIHPPVTELIRSQCSFNNRSISMVFTEDQTLTSFIGALMPKVFLIIMGATLLIASAIYSSPQTQAQSSADKNTAAVHAGQDIYTHKCLQCHSVNEGEVRLGPSLYGEMRKPNPKKSASAVRTILENGKGKMPSFQDKLTKQDIDNLLAYLRTL